MQSGPWSSLQSSEVIVKPELLRVGVRVAVGGTGVDVAVSVEVGVSEGWLTPTQHTSSNTYAETSTNFGMDLSFISNPPRDS